MVYLETQNSERVRQICKSRGLRFAELGEGKVAVELVKPAGHRGYPKPRAFDQLGHQMMVDLIKVVPGANPDRTIYLTDRPTAVAELVPVEWSDGAQEKLVLVRHGLIIRATQGGIVETTVSRPKLRGNPPEYRPHIHTASYRSSGELRPVLARYASQLGIPCIKQPKKPRAKPRDVGREDVEFKELRLGCQEKMTGPDRRHRRR